MPDLSTRREHEALLVTALLQEFEAFRSDLRSAQNLPAEEHRQKMMVMVPAFQAAVEEAAVVPLSNVYRDAALNLAAEKNVDSGTEQFSRQAQQYASGRARQLASGVVDTTVDALAGGESTDTALGVARAEQIATTEVTTAISAGEIAAAALILIVAQITLVPLWHTEQDERVCPVCQPLSGTGREVYGRVSPTGPPAHPNCRCWLDYEERT